MDRNRFRERLTTLRSTMLVIRWNAKRTRMIALLAMASRAHGVARHRHAAARAIACAVVVATLHAAAANRPRARAEECCA
jgi:hypothetical protein